MVLRPKNQVSEICYRCSLSMVISLSRGLQSIYILYELTHDPLHVKPIIAHTI